MEFFLFIKNNILTKLEHKNLINNFTSQKLEEYFLIN
jgi:hypothetical protein